MRGEFIAVWNETWREIWQDLSLQEKSPADIYCEIFRSLNKALIENLNPGELADIIDNPKQAALKIKSLQSGDFIGERSLTLALEECHDIIEDLGGPELASHYNYLLKIFISKYSLRYELHSTGSLHPSLPGVFASLFRELKTVTSEEPHLNELMTAFEVSLRDLRKDHSEIRIKNCIAKQMNLLEAIGATLPGVTSSTLGAICNQANTWPHSGVKDAIKNLYSFSSDYPGIRHGGTPANAIRNIEMRDLVAITILLLGYTPYLTDRFNADKIYIGE